MNSASFVKCDLECPSSRCTARRSMKNSRLCPAGIPTPACQVCRDGDWTVKRSRGMIPDFQSSRHRISSTQIVQQPHHCGVENGSNNPSLSDAVIPLKAFVDYHCTCVPITIGGKLHAKPCAILQSASKAVLMEYPPPICIARIHHMIVALRFLIMIWCRQVWAFLSEACPPGVEGEHPPPLP
jgi:hypothetical protein